VWEAVEGKKGEKGKFGPYMQSLLYICHCMRNLRLGFILKIRNKNVENHLSAVQENINAFHSSSNRTENSNNFYKLQYFFVYRVFGN
jgi:hypothetical protein